MVSVSPDVDREGEPVLANAHRLGEQMERMCAIPNTDQNTEVMASVKNHLGVVHESAPAGADESYGHLRIPSRSLATPDRASAFAHAWRLLVPTLTSRSPDTTAPRHRSANSSR